MRSPAGPSPDRGAIASAADVRRAIRVVASRSVSSLHRSRTEADSWREEVEAHLEDALQHQLAAGKHLPQAWDDVLNSFGDPGEVRDGFRTAMRRERFRHAVRLPLWGWYVLATSASLLTAIGARLYRWELGTLARVGVACGATLLAVAAVVAMRMLAASLARGRAASRDRSVTGTDRAPSR